MKKIILILFILFLLPNFVFAYSITVSPNATVLDFGSHTPIYNYGNLITDSNWANAPYVDIELRIGPWSPSEITDGKNVKIYCYFQNKNHPNFPTSGEKATILNTIANSRESGLAGFINFDTVNLENIEDSFLPVRAKIWHYSYLGGNDWYTGQYATTEEDKWIWLQDYDVASKVLNKKDYAKILELNAHLSSEVDKFFIRLKTSISIDANSGKRAGTYYSRLFFLSDLQ